MWYEKVFEYVFVIFFMSILLYSMYKLNQFMDKLEVKQCNKRKKD